jgi:uncharacterized NAD(P)/FAD-binding protein YdhS
MKEVVIIGNGAAAATLVYCICKNASDKINVVVLGTSAGSSAGLGLGMAYGTQCKEHLLNVPVGKISALADEPDDFFDWLTEQAIPSLDFDRSSFVPRLVYAHYLRDLVRRGLETNPLVSLTERGTNARGVAREGQKISVLCEDGSTLLCDKLILAMGNREPQLPSKFQVSSSARVVANPWDYTTSMEVPSGSSSPIVLIGTGLTAVDMLAQLRANSFLGKVLLLSRHGLLPQTHTAHEAVKVDWSQTKSLRQLLRRVRVETKKAENWRSIVDSLRPFVQALWMGFSVQEKRRFLRHLRTYWDTHRHRMAASVAAFVDAELSSGSTQIQKGHIRSVQDNGTSVSIRYGVNGDSTIQECSATMLINCTGASLDWRDSVLASTLFHAGLAQPGSLGLGFLCDADGQIIDCENNPSEQVYAIGSLLAGSLWESTAMPEIRVQAAQISKRIC